MRSTRSRRLRWALRGALVLAVVAIVLGGLFTVVIALFEQRVPADAGPGFWAGLLLQAAVIWGLGALPFGAALGLYASMIWRDDGS